MIKQCFRKDRRILHGRKLRKNRHRLKRKIGKINIGKALKIAKYESSNILAR